MDTCREICFIHIYKESKKKMRVGVVNLIEKKNMALALGNTRLSTENLIRIARFNESVELHSDAVYTD